MTGSPVLKAVACSLTGLFLLDLMAVFVKFLGADYPIQMVIFFRNFFGIMPLAVILFHQFGREALSAIARVERPWLACLRGALVTCAQLSFYTSLSYLELATAAALAFSGPFFTTMISIPLLGHRIGIWRWGAVALGFAGVMLVMRPGSDLFTWYALLPLAAALFYSFLSVSSNLFPSTTSTGVINIISSIVASLLAGVFMLTMDTSLEGISLRDWSLLLGTGICGGIGVYFLIMAYRMTRPSNVAPFDYLAILFSFALGYIFFAEAPVERLFPGVLLIVGSGLVIIARSRKHEV